MHKIYIKNKIIHFVTQKTISTDNEDVTGPSILSGIPSHSNQVQSQTSGLAEQALLIYCF